MSYNFQTILVSSVLNMLKISASGSNSYTDPCEMTDPDFSNTAPALYCGTQGLECILIWDYDKLNYYAFFFDYKADSGKERWITVPQAVEKGYHLENIFSEDSGDIYWEELSFGPLPDKYLRLLIELNVANAREVSITEEELRSILIDS